MPTLRQILEGLAASDAGVIAFDQADERSRPREFGASFLRAGSWRPLLSRADRGSYRAS